MTDKMIAQTLDEHNVLRAKFARGEVEGYPGKVKRMSKLVGLSEFDSETQKKFNPNYFPFFITFIKALGSGVGLLC